MKVLIYKKPKSATQSGVLNFNQWILKFLNKKNINQNNVMGWISSANPQEQIILKFKSKKLAIKYAENNNYEYNIIEDIEQSIKKKSYADNFTN